MSNISIQSITEKPAGLPSVRVSSTTRSPFMICVKRIVQMMFGVWVLPRRIVLMIMRNVVGKEAFRHASESISIVPGLRGVYQRQAFYRRTLAKCGQDVCFGWNSVFSMVETEVGERVYVGRFCSIGFAKINDEVMLADHVQILSGGNEHGRASDKATMMDQERFFEQITIGRGAWIGAGAIVMADVGAGAIIGAGAVVNRSIPDNSVAVGVPAKVVKTKT